MRNWRNLSWLVFFYRIISLLLLELNFFHEPEVLQDIVFESIAVLYSFIQLRKWPMFLDETWNDHSYAILLSVQQLAHSNRVIIFFKHSISIGFRFLFTVDLPRYSIVHFHRERFWWFYCYFENGTSTLAEWQKNSILGKFNTSTKMAHARNSRITE